jgi:ATP-dependent helicase/nuclease subunit A
MTPARRLLPTPEQQLAIDLYAPYLLVSASAGTGKTKTLVDKVIAALQAGCPLDRLLVITFTKKAAQELRERLFEQLGQHPELRPQRFLLPQAYISTIDAFCARLLRENAVAVQVDPAFRMLPQPEDRLMLAEILDDLFHHWYLGKAPPAPAGWDSWREIPAAGTPTHQEFLRLVDLCAFRQGREVLKLEIERLLQRARVHPDPDAYVAALAAGLQSATPPYLPSLVDALQTSWRQGGAILEALLAHGREQLAKYDLGEFARLHEVWAAAPPIAGAAGDELIAALGALRQHLEAAGFMEPNGPWDLRLPAAPRGTKTILKPFTERAAEWLGMRVPDRPGGPFTWLPDPLEELGAQYGRTRQTLQTLLTLLRQTMQRYAHRKREEGYLDFADLELACRRLLQSAGLPVRERFDLVLVDEFQDINQLQAEMIAGLRPARGRFLVGDTKQCIYQFRLADPGIFRNYFAAAVPYRPDTPAPQAVAPDHEQARLFLSHNFRSRYPVLAVVNDFFDTLLSPEMIGGPYADEALHFSAAQGLDPALAAALPAGPAAPAGLEALPAEAFRESPAEWSTAAPPASRGFAPVEIHLLERAATGGAPDAGLRREARLIAGRIRRLLDERFPIFDEQAKQWRPAALGDIAILLRSPAVGGAVVARELRAAGIPTLFGVQSFFERQEIRDALNLMHLLDNAENDIALAGVLRGPGATFEDDDLVHLRLAWPESHSLLAALQATSAGEETPWSGPPAAEQTPAAALTRKCHRFLAALAEWRSLVQCSDLPSALAEIFEASGLLAGAAGDEGGRERAGNLAQLLALTRNYCRERGHSLPGLVRFLAATEAAGRGPEPVVAAGGAAHAVQILSQHRAKGLEFPIVFLAALGRQVNTQDLRQRILTGEDWLGIDLFDPREYVRTPTVARHLLAWQKRRELIEEELRILYVACTRAREKLIISGQLGGSWENLLKKSIVWSAPRRARDALTYRAHRPLDWLLAYLSRRGILADLANPDEQTRSDRALLVARHADAPAPVSVERRRPEPEAQAVMPDLSRLAAELARPYAHEAATRARGKYWATEIKRLIDQRFADEEREIGSALPWDRPPAGSPDEAAASLARGSRLHAILEMVDLADADPARAAAAAARTLAERGALPPEWITPENLQPVERFLASPLAAEMRAAGESLQREVSFSLRLDPRRLAALWPDAAELRGEEWLLLQGQIDALWRRADGCWVVLDFKSDRVATATEIAARREHYRPQMLIYREAVTRLWQADAVECMLYFLMPGEGLTID